MIKLQNLSISFRKYTTVERVRAIYLSHPGNNINLMIKKVVTLSSLDI